MTFDVFWFEKHAPKMKSNRFFGSHFFGVFFGQVWENLGKTPSRPQKFACSYTYWLQHNKAFWQAFGVSSENDPIFLHPPKTKIVSYSAMRRTSLADGESISKIYCSRSLSHHQIRRRCNLWKKYHECSRSLPGCPNIERSEWFTLWLNLLFFLLWLPSMALEKEDYRTEIRTFPVPHFCIWL